MNETISTTPPLSAKQALLALICISEASFMLQLDAQHRVGLAANAGMWAAISVLAALRDRVKTGKGTTVETSLVEAALFWWDGVFAQYVANGRSPSGQQIRANRALWRILDG